MKTSNRLLLAVIVILIGYMLSFDFSLKAEYLKGDYKSRFAGMKKLDLKKFNAVEHNVANFIQVEIQQGPEYAVWVTEELSYQVAITNHNKTLHIDYTGTDKPRGYGRSIIITCPVINSVVTNNLTSPNTDWYNSMTRIKGFNEDSLYICAGRSTEIALNNNTINKLTGKITDSRGIITVHGDNEVKQAGFNILGRSELKILNPIIGKTTYSYTDSATITVSGRALHLLQQ